MGGIQLEKALAIDGWMSPTELKWLARVAKESTNILEVGCYKGRSTRALVDNTSGVVTAVDPWVGPYIKVDGKPLFDQAKSWPEFLQNLSNADNLKIVKLHFDQFYSDEKYDFIFLDGDHLYDMVVHDINKALTMLTPRGILAGHDYGHIDWPGVKQAVDEIFPTKEIVGSIWAIQKF